MHVYEIKIIRSEQAAADLYIEYKDIKMVDEWISTRTFN